MKTKSIIKSILACLLFVSIAVSSEEVSEESKLEESTNVDTTEQVTTESELEINSQLEKIPQNQQAVSEDEKTSPTNIQELKAAIQEVMQDKMFQRLV